MAKLILALAHSSEIEDFYKHFGANELKKNMGWKYAFNICDPDTERPSKKELLEIENCCGLSVELIGDFAHLIGEFFLATRIDYENYHLPKDFSIVLCDDDADCDKLKVFSSLKGFDVILHEAKGTEGNLKSLHEVLDKFFSDVVTEKDVWIALGL